MFADFVLNHVGDLKIEFCINKKDNKNIINETRIECTSVLLSRVIEEKSHEDCIAPSETLTTFK